MTNKAKALGLIKDCLKNGHPWSLDELKAQTHLSHFVLRRCLRYLVQNNVATCKKEKHKSFYRINKDYFHIGMIALYHVDTRTFYEFKFYNLWGELLDSSFEEHMEDSLGGLIQKIDYYYKHDPLVRSIAIMYPGPVNQGYLYPGAVHYLANVNLKHLLETRFPISFTVENDANTAVYGYTTLHPNVHDAVLFYQPNGVDVGVGLIFNGQLYRGHNGMAGELKIMHDDSLMGNAVFNLKDALQRTILLLNPQTVLLHSFILDHLEFAQHLDNVPKAMQPEVEIIKDINVYFDEGLRRLAIENCKV